MGWLSDIFGPWGAGEKPKRTVPMVTFTEAQIMAPVQHIMPAVPANTPQALREIKRGWQSIVHHLERTPHINGERIPGVHSAGLSLEVLSSGIIREEGDKVSIIKKLWEQSMQYTHAIEAAIAAHEEMERIKKPAMVYDLDAFRTGREIRRAEAPKDTTSAAFVLRTFLKEFRELDKTARAPANEPSDAQPAPFVVERKHRPF